VLASIRSAAVLGIAAYDVTVEVDVAAGLPAWTIVGLASSAVKEARERVSSALNNSGFALPSRRVTINLSPGNDAEEKTNRRRIAFAVVTHSAKGSPVCRSMPPNSAVRSSLEPCRIRAVFAGGLIPDDEVEQLPLGLVWSENDLRRIEDDDATFDAATRSSDVVRKC
jgi:hypothetical protein